jgi:uncharacterized protein with HEPN domain
MRSDHDTLLDIIQACQRIQLFTNGMSVGEFLADLKTQAAVQLQLLILGEATKRISDSFRAQYPEIPRSPMARMRDKLIHSYDLVNQEEVWRTATDDVPPLLIQLQAIV